MRNIIRILAISIFLLAGFGVSQVTFARSPHHGDHPGIGLPAAPQHVYEDTNPHPTGTDPLTANEIVLAQDIAIAQAQNSQFMSAERHAVPKNEQPAQRRADVVFYHYATDQVIHLVVNLHTREVEATQVLRGEGHQPPVIRSEAEAAVKMILAHPTLAQDLQQVFLRATGQFLLDARQVQAQGILFVPDGSPDTSLSKTASACRQHRCIQLFLRTANAASNGVNSMIDASNVVADLSAGQLLWDAEPFKALALDNANDLHRSPIASPTHDAAFACTTGQPLMMTMTIGTRWGLCWAHEPSKGLVLSQVSFAPNNGELTLILGSAALAQIYVAYDDGTTQRHDVTDSGLPLRVLTASDCPQGTLLRDTTGAARLCQRVQPRGYAWRGSDQVQGQSWVLFGISQVGNDMWTHQWVLDDDGALHPMLGASGQPDALRSGDKNNRTIAAYWRLNFDIGGSADDAIEQFDYVADANNAITRTQTALQFTHEVSLTLSPEAQRFWRIKDTQITNSVGLNISYQIVPQLSSVYRGSSPFTQADLYVTNNNACEQFISHNPIAGGCGAGVNEFVNNEALDAPNSDIVVWFGANWHQVFAKDDEWFVNPHWQGLTLLPRDFLNTSPLRTAVATDAPLPTNSSAASASPLNCSSPYQITQTFANTARWEMCWEPRAGYGYRLNQIMFTHAQGERRFILNTLHVALMFVPYDDGGPRFRDTSLDENLALLTGADCPNGLLLTDNTLCLTRRTTSTGDEGFVVFGYISVANYYYVMQFAFNADGSIAPSVGASGSLQRYTHDATTGWPVRGLIASNHNHWVIWRMDFDLDGPNRNMVKQVDVVNGMNAVRTLTATALLTETKAQNDLSRARFWQVASDSGPTALTYAIEPSVTDVYRANESFTHNDFYATQNNVDEAQVSDAFGLDRFVDGEPLQDVVTWYGVNFHHVPRTEEDYRMPIHWQGFVMRLQDRGLARRVYVPLFLR